MQISALILTILSFTVTDGDTLRADDIGIRIWGIDAPEMDSAAGRRSRQAMVDLAGDGPLICEVMDIDHYGRIVARCKTTTGIDLACSLVSQGSAKDWPRFSGGFYRDC